MSRNLDSTLSAGLSAGLIQPAVFVQLTLRSGVEYIWSGIGDSPSFGGKTFKGVGDLGSVGPIAEGSAVKADGTSVMLSGIGLSQLDIPDPPATPPDPPVTPDAGESVAWAFATAVSPSGSFAEGPSLFNGELGNSGSWSGTKTSGELALINGNSLGPNTAALSWSGFAMPPEVPPNAVFTRAYPVFVISALGGSALSLACTGTGFSGASVGTNAGGNVGALAGQTMSANIANSVPGGPTSYSATISFVGFAIYYKGSPLSKTSLIYEALNDVRIGGPAKIWYGLMSNGALLGTPYLIFSGTVDKPKVVVDVKSASIALALENRLVNLQRANQRRYTAADQKLAYPTDNSMNWIETLNDIALRWGN